jgi:23S rRNA (uracil1939-C5)-methyltransferase
MGAGTSGPVLLSESLSRFSGSRLSSLPFTAQESVVPHTADNGEIAAGATIELTVGDLAHGGAAVGRLGDLVVFVQGAAPGERVRARITERRRTFARAVTVNVLDASPDRIAPPCSFFRAGCGGCQWQFLAYPAQVAAKQRILRDHLRRALKLDDRALDALLQPPIGMRDPWHYRNIVEIVPDERGRPSFRHLHSHEPVPISHCPISQRPINGVLEHLNAEGIAKETTIRHDAAGDGAVAFTADAPRTVTETLLGQPFRVSGASFFQVNTKPEVWDDEPVVPSPSIENDKGWSMADLLALHAVEGLALTGRETVLDAYAGVGTFAVLAAKRARRVIAVEEVDAAARDARHNARAAGAQHVIVHTRKAERFLPTLREPIHAAVLDPPRAGCAPAVLDALLRLQPRRLVYVSCDPATLARDLAALVQGYTLQSVQLLDLFPQTFHLEAVAVLERRKE